MRNSQSKILRSALSILYSILFCALVLALSVTDADAVTLSSKYVSPRNKEREVRKSTKFIILHTTEGAAAGSLKKLSANGECHYAIDTDGKTYRIIDRSRIAFHCGLSMWNGLEDIDKCSVGIEMVGYHDKKPTAKQIASLKELLAELKKNYKLTDENILTHSMVAYGTPNRWQKQNHRGRKRCAMIFADTQLRKQLGIMEKPSRDPDIKAKRLADGDPELTRTLYAK